MEQKYTVIDWYDKDDVQKLLTVLECDAALALNDALQFQYVLEFFNEHLDFINKAPCFWMGVITSLRYSMLMQAARLFDESKDAIGIRKILNQPTYFILRLIHFLKTFNRYLKTNQAYIVTYQ